MRILYIASRELSYPRNDVILRAFQRFADVQVLGVDTRQKSLLKTSGNLALKSATRLIKEDFDLVYVGFYGQLLMLVVRLLTRKPILFDAFVSTYDTLIADRGLFAENSIPGQMAYWLDKIACNWGNRILLDTGLHINYFVETYGLPIDKFDDLPVGCNEEIFHPSCERLNESEVTVLYYSSYLPLHGVDTVVLAAAQLRTEPVKFRLIGNGHNYDMVRRLVSEKSLSNIEFFPYVPLGQLPEELANADIALGGHFGLSDKAGRVIPGKIYQILACARPLIAGDTPANRSLLTHGQNAMLCPPGNPAALADTIRILLKNPDLREHLANQARKRYDEVCSETIITERLRLICSKMNIL